MRRGASAGWDNIKAVIPGGSFGADGAGRADHSIRRWIRQARKNALGFGPTRLSSLMGQIDRI